MKRTTLFSIVALLVMSFTGVQAQDKRELTVFAAASLTDTFEVIADAFEQENPEVTILFNFGGSSTLATQLDQGAPADVFASANNKQMQVAVDSGRIAGTPITFAKNRLVLIVPANNPAQIQSVDDLANSGINLILAAPAVPVRAYTDTMLEKMVEDATYGEAYRDAVLANLVSEEPNVRQVSAKVALGEADAGIVYASDVTPDIVDDVMAFPIPDAFNTIASYPIAMTNDTSQPELAQQFIDFVLSDVGQDSLVTWGFVSIRMPETADDTLQIEGQVLNPLFLTVDALRADYPSYSTEVTYNSGDAVTVNYADYTGVLLWDLIAAAQPDVDENIRNHLLSMVIVVTGTDGYQIALSIGEIHPDFGNQLILIAYEENGDPIADELGDLHLVVPSDMYGGRYVHGVSNISLRDTASVK